MRFASLGSGSRGNATLVEHDDTLVMIDCGFSVAETERRLARLGRRPEDVSALLVTHEHSDHAAGVMRFARRHRVPVHLTPGTWAALAQDAGEAQVLINCHRPFEVGALTVNPMPVPHDAREPCQFSFRAGRWHLGVLTDTGRLTAHLAQALNACDALVVECNHDRRMLMDGPYPASLKARVGGPLGHLSNGQAAELVAGVQRDRLQWLVGVHLSERNNAPGLASDALAAALGGREQCIRLATQEQGLDWLELA